VVLHAAGMVIFEESVRTAREKIEEILIEDSILSYGGDYSESKCAWDGWFRIWDKHLRRLWLHHRNFNRHWLENTFGVSRTV